MELSRTRKKQYDNILNTASVLFIKRGIESTSMRDIAEAAGVERKTVYNYFSSKEELATHVLMEMKALGEFYNMGEYKADDDVTGYKMLESILMQWATRYNDYKDALLFHFRYDYHFSMESKLKDYMNTASEASQTGIGLAVAKGMKDGSINTDGMDAEMTTFTLIRLCRGIIEKKLHRDIR